MNDTNKIKRMQNQASQHQNFLGVKPRGANRGGWDGVFMRDLAMYASVGFSLVGEK